jgi:hypothetical protein
LNPGTSNQISFQAGWATGERKFKIKVLCGSINSLTGVFTVRAGTPSPYLDIVAPLPNYTVGAFLASAGPQTRTITYKNIGNTAGSACSVYLVSNTQAEEINQNNYPGITLTDTSSFNLAVGATIMKTINIAWNSNSRSFKVKANCSDSNWRVSEAFNVAAGATPPSLSFSSTTGFYQDSRPITVSNNGSTTATACTASICDNYSSSGYCIDPAPSYMGLTNPNGSNFNIPANSSVEFTVTNSSLGNTNVGSVDLKIQCSNVMAVGGQYIVFP